MRILGKKKKAHSWDHIQDIIFSPRVYKRMTIQDMSFNSFVKIGNNTEEQWSKMIEDKLASTLTVYFNHLLRNDLKLPAKQNLIRQIYLPKSKDTLQSFYNCRPISITSPMYKIIDIILNERLTAFLNSDNYYKLDSSQTGFRRKLGCEVNILRLTETIQ